MQPLESLSLERRHLVQHLGESKLIPFLRRDQSPEELDRILSNCAANNFNVLGFMPSTVSEETLMELEKHPLVRSGQINLVATNATVEQFSALQERGIKIICCFGNLDTIEGKEISANTLFIPIVNDLQEIPGTLDFLEQRGLPSVLKIHISSGNHLSPEELDELCKQFPKTNFIAFGGVRPESARAYTQSGILAAGMGLLLPDSLLADNWGLFEHMYDISNDIGNRRT